MSSSRSSGWKRSYTNKLQGCNTVHIICGLVSLGLACSQFSKISLENYNYIDFRLLNWVHIVTGGVGIFMVIRNYGSIAAKSLYITSAILGLFTAGFYANNIVQAVKRYQEISGYSDLDGAEDDGYSADKANHTGKIAVCATMIIIGLMEFITGLISIKFLAKLASEANSNLRNRGVKDRGRLAFIAGMKLFFSAATVILGAYLEHLYQRQTKYIKIGWQELAGGIVACSGFVDLIAVNGNRHNLLNLKVSLVMSVTAAVTSLKTVDYMMSGYFLSDVSEYTNFKAPEDEAEDPFGGLLPSFTTLDPLVRSEIAGDTKRQLFVKFSIHASVIGCLVLLFIHCIISAIEAGSYMERSVAHGYVSGVETLPAGGVSATVVDHHLHRQRNCLGVFQFSWGILLIALCIISLVPWQFAEGYTNGPGILWVGCLFVASGSASSNRIKTLTTSVYTLAAISSVVALEYFLFTINSIYHSVNHEMYKGEAEKKHTGRIVLYSIQAGVLFGEFCFAASAAATFGKEIQRLPRSTATGSVSAKSYLSFFHFVYAIFTIGVSIVSEIGVWRFEGSPIHNSYVKQTNGPIIFVAGIIQILASSKPEFLLPSSILQVVCAGITFFVLAPAMTNLYYLIIMYQVQYDPLLRNMGQLSDSEINQKLIQELAIGLTAAVAILSMIEYVISIISAMHSSYLMHHYFSGVKSDGGRFSTMRSHLIAPAYGYGESSQMNGGASVISQPRSSNGVIVQNGVAKNGVSVQRYFGNDYRTYAENRMYNPDDVVFKTGNSNQYGYVQQNRLNSYAQTNVRHVFHNVHNGYLTAYT